MAETIEEIKAKRKGSRFVDLTGKKFGKLSVLTPNGQNKAKQYLWECICECGNKVSVIGSNLIRNNTKACGCVRLVEIADRTRKHGMSKTRLFHIWAGMRKRCLNTNCDSYKDYGGRGIKICKRWDKFENFLDDMGGSYEQHLTLDRFPNTNGDYELSNCRWATPKQQSNNRRTNIVIEIDGISKTLAQWSEISGIKSSTINTRLKAGWENLDAVYKKSIQNKLSSISKYLVF